MDFSFGIYKKDKKTLARAGKIITPHGEIETPAFSPVATRASVRTLSPEDIKDTNSQVILGNTYHLYLRPGTEIIRKFQGFGPFMGWNGPTITDSGGYQISFLWDKGKNDIKIEKEDKIGRVIKITDKGMDFYSHIDGSKHLLTPEKSMEIQSVLGADIIMSLDQPMGYKFTEKQNNEAYERTFDWEERSFLSWNKNGKRSHDGKFQALFGIIQGELDKRKRLRFLKFILSLGFPGIAIGDETIGSDPKITAKSLDIISGLIPDDKPLHALGLGGGPEGIFEAVSRGVDLFDNSSVTRMARTGLLFIYPEDGGNMLNKFRVDIKKSKFKDMKKPFSKICSCYSCQNFSAAYLHHLTISEEVLGLRLATIHNVTFVNNLMEQIRKSIKEGEFVSYKRCWLRRA
jgi:queuine tRNA-ribosyltransferase